MAYNDIRSWRERLSLTQERAGEILGVTSRAVAKWEAGQAPIDNRTKLAIQQYEQKHVTTHGIEGRPLLYTVYVAANSDDNRVGETYLVIARDEFEADKLVSVDLGAREVTLTAACVARAPSEARSKILATVAELVHGKRVTVVSRSTHK